MPASHHFPKEQICMQRFIKIGGKVRTYIAYPAGFMDVISIDKAGENFRLIYGTKGHFAVHRVTPEEAKSKLYKVRKSFVGTKGIPHLVSHDAHTIQYPDPLIKVNDTIQIDLETGKITDFKFDTGNLCMVTGGANLGRIGVITIRERHPGSFDVVHVKDAHGNSFATRLSNIFVVGKDNKPWIPFPRGKGIRLTIAEERGKRPNRAVGEMVSRRHAGEVFVQAFLGNIHARLNIMMKLKSTTTTKTIQNTETYLQTAGFLLIC